ncbi:transposase, partial [Streptomyces sp. TRM75561]|uniref:transposase n=1 Tax=Streptomyces sp. TRM75561 TaxID=2975269 RepID=UPI00244C7CBB
MSAISTKGRMHFMVLTDSFTAEVMCRFPERLAGHFDRKVHLVVDGHSAHRSKKVRDWLATHPDDVELHFLPPYSPPTDWSTRTSSTACPDSTGPGPRPNSPPKPAASSADATDSPTSSAATSAAHTSVTSWTRTPSVS